MGNNKEKSMFKTLINVDNYESKTIKVIHSIDNSLVITMTRKMARKIGFSKVDEAIIATAASELATNILRYAKNGKITLIAIKLDDKHGIEIQAQDKGPGILSLKKVMQPGYTTTKRSLGLGLSSVLNIMDDFYIESEIGIGTRIISRKWCR